LKFDQQPGLRISSDDTGKAGTVVFGLDESPRKNFQGKIVRVLLSDSVLVVAISVTA